MNIPRHIFDSDEGRSARRGEEIRDTGACAAAAKFSVPYLRLKDVTLDDNTIALQLQFGLRHYNLQHNRRQKLPELFCRGEINRHQRQRL